MAKRTLQGEHMLTDAGRAEWGSRNARASALASSPYKRDFHLLATRPDLAFLDSAATAQRPTSVLDAQRLGLNSCWVAGTAKRRAVRQTLAQKDKLVAIIALGHGTTQGEPHRSRTIAQVSRPVSNVPEWFARGVRYALLAPTAMNQQTFWVQMTRKTNADGLPLVALSTNGGPCARVDLGIVKLHFELGAGTENFAWADPVVH